MPSLRESDPVRRTANALSGAEEKVRHPEKRALLNALSNVGRT
jgi:hypothetical protein